MLTYAGVAWLLLARALKCQVKSENGRNPFIMLKIKLKVGFNLGLYDRNLLERE